MKNVSRLFVWLQATFGYISLYEVGIVNHLFYHGMVFMAAFSYFRRKYQNWSRNFDFVKLQTLSNAPKPLFFRKFLLTCKCSFFFTKNLITTSFLQVSLTNYHRTPHCFLCSFFPIPYYPAYKATHLYEHGLISGC